MFLDSQAKRSTALGRACSRETCHLKDRAESFYRSMEDSRGSVRVDMLSHWKLLSKRLPVSPRNTAHDQPEPMGAEMDPRRQKHSHCPPTSLSRTKGTWAKAHWPGNPETSGPPVLSPGV